MDVGIYLAKKSEKTCCTCNRWIGARVMVEDDFVCSMEELEGICNGIEHPADRAEFNGTLTFPDANCNSWEKWREFEVEIGA